MINSSVDIRSFDPHIIPYHFEIIRDIRKNYDYSKGMHEILMSGSVGSGKSTLLSHVVLTHCLFNPGARFLIGRLSMPALRSTVFNKILEHIGPSMVEGRDFWVNLTTAGIKFKNGSEVVSRSWSDRKYFKVRSLELSAAAIEEIIETETPDFYNEIKMRVGRLPHIKENIIISATNPGSPSSWQYKHFIEGEKEFETRHVYYSRTEDNPFLPKQYIEQLKKDLDPQLAKRMLYGQWIDISKEVIYYAYDDRAQFRRDQEYVINPREPVWLSWDFNIGEGKPLSVVAAQKIGETVHCFKEFVIEGMRTEDSCEEIEGSGLLEQAKSIIITGDATGKHRDTRSRASDYDIIKRYFANLTNKVPFEVRLSLSNPPIRQRHNVVNAMSKNENGDVRLYLYKGMDTLDEGLRLTSLKKGGQLVEDDSKYYQHITTALGYMLVHMQKTARENKSRIL